MLTVGERIKQRRLELGLSRDMLAQQAGISKSFLSDLETGKRIVGAETPLDLGRAMQLSLDFLMTGEESGDPKPDVQIPASLAAFAAEEGLSFRQALTLLHMQRVVVANRKNVRRNGLENVNWHEFYRAVKKYQAGEHDCRWASTDNLQPESRPEAVGVHDGQPSITSRTGPTGQR